MIYCAVSVLIMHTVGQLCVIFFSSFSLLSVWHLLNLSGVYWYNNWCLHSPTPPLFSGAPNAPTQWIHLHPDYRTNCHAGRKANQILQQQLGEEIAFPLSGRDSGHRLCASGFTGEKEAKGEKGKVTRLQEVDRKSSAGQVTPLFFHLHPLACHFPLPSPLILTLPISHPVTPGATFLSPILQIKRNNDYGDRVTLSAKLGPLRSQQHIVQPD